MKKLCGFLLSAVFGLSLFGCAGDGVCKHPSLCGEDCFYELVDGRLYGLCPSCGESVLLSNERLSDLENAIFIKTDGGYKRTDKTLKELTAAAPYGGTLDVVLGKGNAYILESGKPQVRGFTADVLTVNVYGVKDGAGNLVSEIVLDNLADTETHCRYLSHLNLTVKDVVLLGEDADANGDARHGAGFMDANRLTVENCVLKKSLCFWNYGNEYTVKDSVFCEPVDTSETQTAYEAWTRGGGTWNFTGCTFISHGKAVKVYATTGAVNVMNCSFTVDIPVQKKYAVEVDASAAVTVENCTADENHKGLKA